MPIYQHRQTGTLIIAALTLGLAICGFVYFGQPGPDRGIIVGVVTAVLLLCVWIFRSLSVEVTSTQIAVWFGTGTIKRRFPVEQIRAVRQVRNKWYYGWGIRLTPHGWLFNVAGLDAVELEFSAGRKFRVGTDDPERLVAAIQQVMPSHQPH